MCHSMMLAEGELDRQEHGVEVVPQQAVPAEAAEQGREPVPQGRQAEVGSNVDEGLRRPHCSSSSSRPHSSSSSSSDSSSSSNSSSSSTDSSSSPGPSRNARGNSRKAAVDAQAAAPSARPAELAGSSSSRVPSSSTGAARAQQDAGSSGQRPAKKRSLANLMQHPALEALLLRFATCEHAVFN